MSRLDVLNSLIGPTVSTAGATSLGGAFARYEQDFAKYDDSHWSADGADWAQSNYYDRAFINYVWYARTGEETYLEHGNAIAEDYLKNYVEANDYAVASWWSMPKGLAAHYLVNGDQASLTALGKMADEVVNPWNTENNWANLFDTHQSEGREQARALETLTDAILVGAPSVGVPNIQPNGEDWGVSGGNDFRALAKSLVDKVLTSDFQHADGSRPNYVEGGTADGHPIDKPFMNGLMNEALINYYEQVDADPRIIPFVKANLDYMWAHEWDANAKAFQYIDEPAASGTADTPSPDLNMLIVNGFGFVYQHTGDATYLHRGDLVYEGGVEGTWLEGSKQFNQEYASSYNYVAYTHGDLAAAQASGDQTGSIPSADADPVPTDGSGADGATEASPSAPPPPTPVELHGARAADHFVGGAGDDRLFGNGGNDRLKGGDGSDHLDGGRGKDVLVGGQGADALKGGAGADVFRFNSTDDSTPSASDTIIDFRHKFDRIDLHLIDASTRASGDQAFSFIDDHGFTGKAGELHFVDHVLSGDVNGDKVADFSIHLDDVSSLTHTDFFL
jgi:Ca2+-binding RTX toxin-like protein